MIFPSGTALINPFWKPPVELSEEVKLFLSAHDHFVVRRGSIEGHLLPGLYRELKEQAGRAGDHDLHILNMFEAARDAGLIVLNEEEREYQLTDLLRSRYVPI